MGSTNQRHRKLVSGIWIASGVIKGGEPEKIASGTLTGIALDLRSLSKVLVTNRHVMSGIHHGQYKNPSNREQMYQPDLPGGRLVGVRPEYQPLGKVDLVVLDLADGSVGIGQDLHDLPMHTSRPIVPGTPTPESGDTLTMMGAHGEVQVTVEDVGVRWQVAGQRFIGLVELNLPHRGRAGDSGAGCYKVDANGNYQLVCI